MKTTINKSELFKNAWILVKNFGMNLASALRNAWKIAKLLTIGGNAWQKYGKFNIYIDNSNFLRALGYDWATYKSGNICSATYRDEHISNSKMGLLFTTFSKLYFDVLTGKFHWNSYDGGDFMKNSVADFRSILKF